MSAILALVGLAFAAAAVLVTFTLVALVLRFAIKLILLPLLLIKWLVASVVMLVVAPILFVVGVIGAVVAGLVLALPLMPLLAVGALVWLLVRANRQSAVA